MSSARLDEPRPTAPDRAPRRRRLDVDACYRMAEAGILGPDDRVELIDGEIVDMAPIGSAHAAGSVNNLVRAFARAAASDRVVLSVQNPFASAPTTSRSRT